MSLPPLPEVTVGDPPPEHPLIEDPPTVATPNGNNPATPNAAVTTAADPNQVRIVVGGVSKTGWQRVIIIRGIEVMPSRFTIALTDRFAGDSAQTDINAGDECKVYIGNDLVVTGRVDRVRRKLSRAGSILQITGRSSCRELVDCAVDPKQVPNMQISQATAVKIITMLAGTYKVTVKALQNVGQNIIPQFNVNLGEVVYPIIDRICRYCQFLAYDDTDGSLILAPLGTAAMASGFTEGVNIEDADYETGMDQRYSDYEVYFTSTYTLSDIAPLTPLQLVTDPTVTQFRKLIVISEQNQLDPSLATQRGVWEKVRRYGRSNVIRLTTDTWRDSAAKLWAINSTVTVDSAHLKTTGQKWLIAQVGFRRDEKGTHADLVLMPPAAFSPEPIVLAPQDPQIANARAKAGPS
jgi:prophage tail gpP-like protein